MKNKYLFFLFGSFFVWRIGLLVIVFFATKFVPLQQNFLGGGMSQYLSNPYLWSWFNFDGEHYLSLTRWEYTPLTYFFFPGFPFLIKYLVAHFVHDVYTYALFGLVVSNGIFMLALIGFWKLVDMDYGESIAKLSIILILLFPTSFYFASYYTEATFLAAVVWSIYFARKGKWLLSGVIGGFASLTRIIGIALFPTLLLEGLQTRPGSKKIKIKPSIVYTLLVPLGLSIYMYFLWRTTGDPLNFLHAVGVFGDQRSTMLVLLPQVFYRYIFKIIPSINYYYFPMVFTTLLEFLMSILFLSLSILSFYKLKLSYSLFLTLGYLIPTFSGSFSSLPRYVLVLFPAYILLAQLIQNKPQPLKILVYSVFLVLLIISTTFFVSGYWIS